MDLEKLQVAVIIPCFRSKNHVLKVIENIGNGVERIFAVDDGCPDNTGEFIKRNCRDKRVKVLWNESNLGVGGAVMTGYKAALEEGYDILVKIDSDGQMDPRLIPNFIFPIQSGKADYTKGNRFFDLEGVKTMPKIRLFGNAVLSFMTKFSSGYWNIFDPTNGYTAIHSKVALRLPFDKISKRYFFESDLLFRLNTMRAVVLDIPMSSTYGDEESNLKISKIISEFLVKHLRNFSKRIFYNYYLRDMSAASLELPLGIIMFVFGTVFGAYNWFVSAAEGVATTSGTVMLSALPIISGLQFILAFLQYDISSVPDIPIQSIIKDEL